MSRAPRSKLEAETAAVKQFVILQTKKVICFFVKWARLTWMSPKSRGSTVPANLKPVRGKGSVKTREDVCAVVFTAGSVSPCDLTAKPATEVRFQS